MNDSGCLNFDFDALRSLPQGSSRKDMLNDARGHGCPKPLMMAQEALSKIDEGIIEILVDNEASASNLERFATKNGFYSETTKEDNY